MNVISWGWINTIQTFIRHTLRQADTLAAHAQVPDAHSRLNAYSQRIVGWRQEAYPLNSCAFIV